MTRAKKIDPIREAARSAGLKTFAGGVCNSSHTGERYVSDGKCVACVRARVDAYDSKNKDAKVLRDKSYRSAKKDDIAKKRKVYYTDNIERFSERNRLYREANGEELSEHKKAHYVENRDEYLAKARDYYSENRDAILSRAKAYYKENSDLLKSRALRKRAVRAKRIVDWGDAHTEATRAKEIDLQKLSVQLFAESGVPYAVDHMLPLQGKLVCGLHVADNLQVLPESLNLRKGNRMVLTEPDEWKIANSDQFLVEPAWCKEAEIFYRDRGWDFKAKCYASVAHPK